MENENSVLIPTMTGIWAVTTETSSYIVNLTENTVTRIPGDLATPPLTDIITATLRRDNTTVPLLMLRLCRVGEPMQLLLDIRGDGIPTLRTTTIVQSIEPIEA